jgi:DNA-binding CsgD family transcriptional regulator
MSVESIRNLVQNAVPDTIDIIEKQDEQDLRAIDLVDLLNLNLPPRELILSPWLPAAGLAMIYAPRGVGKTQVSLGISYAVATGSTFLNWDAPKPRKVLFVDGEMPAVTLQQRLAAIAKQNGKPYPPGNLQVITPDLQNGIMPDLATIPGQAQVNKLIASDTDLIVVDNISCLVRSGHENASEDWIPFQTWALSLRAKGKSLLFIHHSGKGGAQRGTSKKEDVLDTVISLKRPNDYNPEEGAHFVVAYEKSRGFCGDDAKPFIAKLNNSPEGAHWLTSDVEETTYEKVISLFRDGLNQNEIAQELDINKSTVCRHIKNARQKGDIKDAKQ